MNHCNLSFEAVEWINGELLGDGSLESPHLTSANFSHTSKHLEYAEYVSTTLASFGVQQSGNLRERYTEGIAGHIYRYRSLAYVELLPHRMLWYPEGKKVVPRQIRLTSLTCRQWYIGDGYLQQGKAGRGIVLSTQGFPENDVEWLVTQLIKLGFSAARQPSINTIRIHTHSVKDFLEYIGKCPVECYKYKWAQANVL